VRLGVHCGISYGLTFNMLGRTNIFLFFLLKGAKIVELTE
jgi:hypothetical protein